MNPLISPTEESAFPSVIPTSGAEFNPGMDLRTYIATAALAGLATREPYCEHNYAALKAVAMADQLIAALKAPTGTTSTADKPN